VLVLVGALVAFMLWVRTQYYVGAYRGSVAIYRGIDASVLGVDLHSVDAVYDDLQVSGLPPYDQQDLESGYPTSTRQNAQGIVDRLRADRDRAQPVPPPPPVPSPSPLKSGPKSPASKPGSKPATPSPKPTASPPASGRGGTP
jgi:protein phosphatase